MNNLRNFSDKAQRIIDKHYSDEDLIRSIEEWINEYDIENYIINKDLTIDVNGDVDLSDKGLTKFPEYIKFNYVKGDFNCSRNQLISLEGFPKVVVGNFRINNNQLRSLKGAPKKVGRDFNCSSNKLDSLEGSPEEVGGSFWLNDNQLKSLKGAPDEVGKYFFG